MKNQPSKVTDVRHLSVETERTVFDDYIRQTLKQVEGKAVAHDTSRLEEVRFARREGSELQPAPCLGHACFRCPRRLDSCRSFGCG